MAREPSPDLVKQPRHQTRRVCRGRWIPAFQKGSENTPGTTVLVNLSIQQAMTSAPSLPAEAGGNAHVLGADSPANTSAAQTGDVEQIVSCSELAGRDTLMVKEVGGRRTCQLLPADG